MLRMLLAMPFGAIVAFLLFVFMAGLIKGGVAMVSKDEKPVTIEFGRVAQETQVQQRVRQVPKKPEPIKPPMVSATVSTASPLTVSVSVGMLTLKPVTPAGTVIWPVLLL